MDLTPELLRNVEFNDARKGGYLHDDVDDFLDKAATDLAAQHARMREMEARAVAAERRIAAMESEGRQRDDADETLRRTLVLAQRTADAAIEEAKADAARIVSEAQQKADGLIEAAEESVRREVGATRDRIQQEIQELETRRTHLHARISDLGAHVESERERIKAQVDTLQALLDNETLAVVPATQIDDEPLAATGSSAVGESPDAEPVEVEPQRRERAEEDLSELPPPPANWEPASEGSGPVATEREAEPELSAPLFEPTGAEPTGPDRLDGSDGGPPTEATPVITSGGSAGSPHLDELRRAVSEGPEAEEGEDAAMAAFFDQDDEETERRRFGRRR